MPYLHLPVQSGSNDVLARMNRTYTKENYLALVDRLRTAIPDLALSTDIIVGFPGETEADFEDTLEVVRTARYSQAFTFIYSPRVGTPAASMGDQVPRTTVQPRFDRLVELVQRSAHESNLPLVGTVQPVLIEGTSKRDASALMGRTPTNRVVHAPVPEDVSAEDLAGRIVPVVIDEAQTWFLSGTLSDTLAATPPDSRVHSSLCRPLRAEEAAMSDTVFGIIAPHPPIMVRAVGGSRADVTEASLEALGMAAKALARYEPDTLVVMSPHAPALADAIAVEGHDRLRGTLGDFGDPVPREWAGDPDLANGLVAEMAALGLPCVMRSGSYLRPAWLDHGTLVPLSFLDPHQSFALVVVSLSSLPYGAHRHVGKAARAAASALGRRVAFIASGDLSHRLTPDAPAGFSRRAADLDSAIVACVQEGRLGELDAIDPELIDAGGECGLRSFIALGGFAGDDPIATRVLAYEGPWGVGYLTALVGDAALQLHDTLEPDAAHRATPAAGDKGGAAGEPESEIVALARRAIESYVRDGRRLDAPSLAGGEWPGRAGAFVSLHRQGRLRGCIGTILPTRDSLAEEVAANAVEAATRDPRFPTLDASELVDLDVKVDVLHAPEACTLGELDPERYGVIVSSGWRRGLLLPDLEGVDDVESQVDIAMSKAGIRPGEACSFERFRVDRYT